jgi:Reversibly glycosylated polypeptide
MQRLPDPSDQRRNQTADTRSVAVVIPIPDDPPWELFDAIPPEIPIIVSDDSDGRLTPPPRDNVFFFDYAAQRDYCGKHYDAMPHKSAASRNVGHYIAYREGFDVIVALDYDCRTRPGWLEAHLTALSKAVEAPALSPVTPNGWVNSIDAPGVYARGYPYEFRTPELAEVKETTATGEVKINMGIWDGILDLNGIDKLQAGEPGDPQLATEVNRIALGNIPVCGMNTSFAAELTPAYFFLPDLWVNGWQLSRHDDIWGGYVVKKLMDLRGDLFAFGHPVVEHTKQTRLERVVVLEQWMHLMSMGFYDLVDEAASRVSPDSYTAMFAAFVDEYRAGVGRSSHPTHYVGVYRELGEWMHRWSEAFTS